MSKENENTNAKKPIPVPETDGHDEDQKTNETPKTNIFKRGWAKVKATGKAIKDNPVASAVCAVAGALATVGVGIFLESRKDSGYITVPAQTDEEMAELGEPEDDEAPAEEAEVE